MTIIDLLFCLAGGYFSIHHLKVAFKKTKVTEHDLDVFVVDTNSAIKKNRSEVVHLLLETIWAVSGICVGPRFPYVLLLTLIYAIPFLIYAMKGFEHFKKGKGPINFVMALTIMYAIWNHIKPFLT